MYSSLPNFLSVQIKKLYVRFTRKWLFKNHHSTLAVEENCDAILLCQIQAWIYNFFRAGHFGFEAGQILKGTKASRKGTKAKTVKITKASRPKKQFDQGDPN